MDIVQYQNDIDICEYTISKLKQIEFTYNELYKNRLIFDKDVKFFNDYDKITINTYIINIDDNMKKLTYDLYELNDIYYVIYNILENIFNFQKSYKNIFNEDYTIDNLNKIISKTKNLLQKKNLIISWKLHHISIISYNLKMIFDDLFPMDNINLFHLYKNNYNEIIKNKENTNIYNKLKDYHYIFSGNPDYNLCSNFIYKKQIDDIYKKYRNKYYNFIIYDKLYDTLYYLKRLKDIIKFYDENNVIEIYNKYKTHLSTISYYNDRKYKTIELCNILKEEIIEKAYDYDFMIKCVLDEKEVQDLTNHFKFL